MVRINIRKNIIIKAEWIISHKLIIKKTIRLELNNIPKVILKNIFTLSVIYPSLSTRAYNNRLKKRVIHIYLTATVNAFPAVTAAILTVG